MTDLQIPREGCGQAPFQKKSGGSKKEIFKGKQPFKKLILPPSLTGSEKSSVRMKITSVCRKKLRCCEKKKTRLQTHDHPA